MYYLNGSSWILYFVFLSPACTTSNTANVGPTWLKPHWESESWEWVITGAGKRQKGEFAPVVDAQNVWRRQNVAQIELEVQNNQ